MNLILLANHLTDSLRPRYRSVVLCVHVCIWIIL